MTKTLTRIQNAVLKGSIHHLLILAGHNSHALEQNANSLAQAWLGATELQATPDYIVRKCQGKIGFHSAASIRGLVEELSFQPFSGTRRVVAILEAERMLPTSSNALLKSLEEPAVGTLFILTTTMIEKILPTIRSRAQLLRIDSDEIESSLPASLQPIVDTFWNGSPNIERIYQISREVDKGLEEDREKRKKERSLDLDQLPKALRLEVEAELEGEVTQYYQEIGRRLIEQLWCGYRQKILAGTVSKPIFQTTFGKNGQFAQALTALDRGMPLSSVLMMLLKSE